MPTTTANERWLDSLIRRQVALARLGPRVAADVARPLDEVEPAIRAEIVQLLAGRITPARRARLLRNLVRLRAQAWRRARREYLSALVEIAQDERRFLLSAFPDYERDTDPQPAEDENPLLVLVQGATAANWIDRTRASDLNRIERTVQIGIVQNETPMQIARRVLGSSATGGTDGATQPTRTNIATIILTAIITMANDERRRFYGANPDFFERERYVAVLDNRTTILCGSLSGRIYLVGEGPHPPMHFRCRSSRVAIILGRNAGPAPEPLTYDQWLRQQPSSEQDEILGPSRAKLYRSGRIQLSQFVNRRGDRFNLYDLRSMVR